MPLYEAENHRLIDELTEIKAQHDEFIGIADDEVRKVTAERDEARSEVYVLKARLKEMERAIRTKEQKPEINIPNDFDDLEAWATLYVGHSVEVLPRALYAAKKSVFDNPPLAYQALLLLNEAYAPMRQSGSQIAKERWEGGLRQLGLECTRTQSSSRAGENPNDYFVDYYEKRMEIDWHLKGSNSRDPRYCFRLYFFWAEDQGKVVVASLPSHLDSRIT